MAFRMTNLFSSECVSKESLEREIDRTCCRDGFAEGSMKFGMGVTGRRPKKKRQATSNSNRQHKQALGRLSSSASVTLVAPREPFQAAVYTSKGKLAKKQPDNVLLPDDKPAPLAGRIPFRKVPLAS